MNIFRVWRQLRVYVHLERCSSESVTFSESITLKMNSPCFQLCRVYSNSLKMSNAGKFPWRCFLGVTHISLERERKIRPPLFMSAIKRKIRHFQVVVVQWRQRNGEMYKKAWCTCKILVLLHHYAKNQLKSGKPKVRQDMRLTAVVGQEMLHRPEATQ